MSFLKVRIKYTFALFVNIKNLLKVQLCQLEIHQRILNLFSKIISLKTPECYSEEELNFGKMSYEIFKVMLSNILIYFRHNLYREIFQFFRYCEICSE